MKKSGHHVEKSFTETNKVGLGPTSIEILTGNLSKEDSIVGLERKKKFYFSLCERVNQM